MQKPWTAIKPELLPGLPAMLGLEEQQFLYWLGQNSEGRPLIDLGTFLGASAACMAAGAKASGSKSTIHSYDMFTYGPWCAPYGMGEGWKDGDDTSAWVRRALGEHADRVRIVKNDICAERWTGEPAEVLFVDFTQNWFHWNHVAKAFLPGLRQGGILAHQDYLYVLCYWLHIFQEMYADHFEPISYHVENGTAAWRYVDPIPLTALNRGLNEVLPFERMLALLERSIARYDGVWRGLVELARIRLFMHVRGPEAAAVEMARVKRIWGDVKGLESHIELSEKEIAIWPKVGGPYEGFFKAA